MAYIGNVGAYDTVDTEQIKDGSVTAAKVAADVATQAELDLKAPLASPSFTGNVGIGTSSPSFDLDILDTSTASNTGAGVNIAHATQPQLRFSQTTGNYRMYVGVRTNDLIIANDSGAEKVRFEQNGNVGIGTSSPASKFEVSNGAITAGSSGQVLVGRNSSSFPSPAIGYFSLDTNNTDGSDGGISFKTLAANALVERMRIDSSGNVGIGTSAPAKNLHVYNSTTNRPALIESGDADALLEFKDNATAYAPAVGATGNNLIFQTGAAATERMRIDSSGNVLVGGSTQFSGANEYPKLTISNATGIGLNGLGNGNVGLLTRPAAAHNYYPAYFINSVGSAVGSIFATSTATSYFTSSDYRLKEDDVPMTGATERVKALRPINFAWKADGSRVDGFFAHELAEVVPEAASGTKDAMMDEEYEVTPATGDVFTAGSEAGFTEVSPAIAASPAYYDVDGNVIKAEVIAQTAVHEAYEAIAEVIHSADVEQPETLEEGQQWRETTAQVMGTRSVPDMQGIDQAKIVPLLTATIQELIARIETLEGE